MEQCITVVEPWSWRFHVEKPWSWIYTTKPLFTNPTCCSGLEDRNPHTSLVGGLGMSRVLLGASNRGGFTPEVRESPIPAIFLGGSQAGIESTIRKANATYLVVKPLFLKVKPLKEWPFPSKTSVIWVLGRTSWWFKPTLWKIWSSNWKSFPQGSVKLKNIYCRWLSRVKPTHTKWREPTNLRGAFLELQNGAPFRPDAWE